MVISARSADVPVWAHPQPRAGHIHLAFTLTKTLLDNAEAEGLVVPPVPPDQGVVLSGKLPLWLYTALALTYAPRAPSPLRPAQGAR